MKDVFAHMVKTPKIEISGICDGKGIRLAAEAVIDFRRDARVAMLEGNPSLKDMYNADNGMVEALYLKSAHATVYSFTDALVTWTL